MIVGIQDDRESIDGGNGVLSDDPDLEEGVRHTGDASPPLSSDTEDSDADGDVVQADNPGIEYSEPVVEDDPGVQVQDGLDIQNEMPPALYESDMSPALSDDNDDVPPPGSRNPSIAEMVKNHEFPYAQVPVIKASRNELRGLKLLSVRHRQKTNNETHNSYVEQINEMLAGDDDERVPNVQQMQRLMRKWSELEFVTYDVCRQSCIAYAGKYRNLASCPFCKTPRINLATRQAYGRFDYIPFIHRLRLLCSNRRFMEITKAYKTSFADRRNTEDGDVITDYWDAEVCQTVREKTGEWPTIVLVAKRSVEVEVAVAVVEVVAVAVVEVVARIL